MNQSVKSVWFLILDECFHFPCDRTSVSYHICPYCGAASSRRTYWGVSSWRNIESYQTQVFIYWDDYVIFILDYVYVLLLINGIRPSSLFGMKKLRKSENELKRVWQATRENTYLIPSANILLKIAVLYVARMLVHTCVRFCKVILAS